MEEPLLGKPAPSWGEIKPPVLSPSECWLKRQQTCHCHNLYNEWVLQTQQNHTHEFFTSSQWAVASHTEPHGWPPVILGTYWGHWGSLTRDTFLKVPLPRLVVL